METVAESSVTAVSQSTDRRKIPVLIVENL